MRAIPQDRASGPRARAIPELAETGCCFRGVRVSSRLRRGDADNRNELGRVSLATINGISSGLRNTAESP
jgi:hypothetical protein